MHRWMDFLEALGWDWSPAALREGSRPRWALLSPGTALCAPSFRSRAGLR